MQPAIGLVYVVGVRRITADADQVGSRSLMLCERTPFAT